MAPLCIVPAKVIGVMRIVDSGDTDDKVIAVCAGDPSVNHKKHVVVADFLDREAAMKIVEESFKMYDALLEAKK